MLSLPRHSRPDFFTRLTAGAVVCLAALLCQPLIFAQGERDDQRPNILYLNADDLGWSDAGFMGSSYYETPNLDRLATEGMVFTEVYASAANCSPSRAAVYTGQYAPRTGVYTVGSSARGRGVFRRLIPVENTPHISESNKTFVSLLKDSGYTTCHIGKWHVSEDPLRHGYETNIGGGKAGSPGKDGYFSPYNIPNLADGPEGEHLTFRLTDEAIHYLREHDAGKPFFLSLQFYIPHTPIQARPETIRKYGEKLPSPTHFNPVYAAMIDHLDTNIGRLLEVLDELRMAENTLVVFTSDNGAIYRLSHQSPLRGEKGSYYEGGIREPTIVRWPGTVRPGSRCRTPVGGIDFYPTFLEAAGVEVPPGKRLDGTSLLPLLREMGLFPDRPLFWHFPIYLQAYGDGNVETRDPLFRTRPGSAMRFGRWKLHEYFEDGGLELYDLEKDVGERRNLVEVLPEKAAELHAMMTQWREETAAPLPTGLNPGFDGEAEAAAIAEFYRNREER